MSRPRLLDLFSGAGGCAVGCHRAGFEVVGVDKVVQPNYPFEFVQADALEYCRVYGKDFDAIHASPPCQRYSTGTRVWKGRAENYPDLVAAVRRMIASFGKVWVIENVPGSPLENPVVVCGLALKCGVKRHRLFESNVPLAGTTCPPGHRGDFISAFGHGAQEKVGGKGWVTVYGGGAPKTADRRRRAGFDLAAAAMGIDWMRRDELSQAIPPAYTEFIGKQLIQYLIKKRSRP